MILTTENLVLRPFSPQDAPDLFAVYQTEGVLQYFPNQNPPPLPKLERFIVLQQAHWEKNGCGNWAVTLRSDPMSTVIGWAGLQYVPELGETEVGYLLGRPHWGKGYATEAASASLKFGFEQMHYNQIIALIAEENVGSRRVAAKCGLVYQNTLDLWGMRLMRHTRSAAG